MRMLLVLLLAALPGQAQEAYALRLTLVHFAGGSWQAEEIVAAACLRADRARRGCGPKPARHLGGPSEDGLN